MAAAATMAIPEIPKREGVEAVEWNQGLDALDLHIPHPAIKVSRARKRSGVDCITHHMRRDRGTKMEFGSMMC